MGETETLKIGKCKVYFGNFIEDDIPSIEMGVVEEAEIKITRETLDLRLGHPELLTFKWAVGETGKLTLKGWEWKLQNFLEFYSSKNANENELGRDYAIKLIKIRLEHVNEDDKAICYLDFWRCTGAGSIEFSKQKGMGKFDYSFDLWRSLSNWKGDELNPTNRLFEYMKLL